MTIKKVLLSISVAALIACAFVSTAHAVPKGIKDSVYKTFTPAIENRGLETAYVEPDPGKFRNFVVVEKGGIPAERARHFITWSEYDYRGVVIHLGEDDRVTTRRGKPYTYLKRGDVMAVAGIKYFSNTIYLKLISDDVYVPLTRSHDKRHSRVTVMLGFKFPKGVIKGDESEAVIAEMEKWLKPFPTLSQAKAYSVQLKGEESYAAAPANDAGADKAPPDAEKAEDEKMKSLEEKIEKARREIDEAEQELKSIKKSK
jgi:hypothetical protein